MNNLTSILVDKHSHIEVEEYVKQGQALTFDSGKEHRIVGGSIPAMEVTLTYRNITIEKYEALRTAYEDNYANTFICTFDDNIDKRSQLLSNNGEVYIFGDWQFSANASNLNSFSGKITLLTSVFFNFTQYQSLFAQSSSYTPNLSTDTSFLDVLDYAQPYNISYKYANQSLLSNIGTSARHMKDKGIKKAWALQWLLNESDFLKLHLFNRKKSGIMGEFGFPEYGSNTGFEPAPYVADGYVVDGYVSYDGDFDGIIKARFVNESFMYQKRIDGLYVCEAEFIELKD